MSTLDRIAKAILAGKPGGPHPGGIHVYHSSPYDFDKFDWNKLRSGQGANTYGSGFYFAENPAVSGQGGQYWEEFARKFQGTPELEAAQILRNNKFDRVTAIEEVKGLVKHYDDKHSRDILKLLETGNPIGPRTYEVNINARPELMLDWDKPLRDQPQIVERMPMLTEAARQEAHDRAIAATSRQRQNELWDMVKDPLQSPGGVAYQKLSGRFGGMHQLAGGRYSAPFTDEVAASKALAEAGIPGIRYLDQGSRILPAKTEQLQNSLAIARNAGDPQMIAKYERQLAELQPSYNYVVTDPSTLDIMAKYGVVGGAAVPVMGALADPSRYEARQ